MSETYNSVSKMMDSLMGGEPIAASVKERIKDRKIVKSLQAMRMAKDIPQSRIAEELNCGQSRVSKIENGDDRDVSLGEVEAYARAFDCDVNIAFSRRSETGVERVKRHAIAIRRELDKLAECAHTDDDIAFGVASFFGEAFFNLLRIVEKSAEKMPLRPDNGEPYIKITSSFADCENTQEGQTEVLAATPTIARQECQTV